MRKLLLLLIFFTLVRCDEDGNSSNALSNSTETQVNNNTSMINMIKNDIEDIKTMLEMIKTQIQSLEDQNVPTVLVPVPVPVPVPACCDDSQPKLDIVDTNGTVLGEAIGPYSGNTSFSTVLELNNNKYVVIVSSFGIQGAFGGVAFANDDCTGQAYLDKGASDLVMVIPTSVAPADATMDPNNETLYEADLNNQVNTTFNSIWSISNKNCDVVSNTTDLYMANPVFDLSTLFEPPYSIQ